MSSLWKAEGGAKSALAKEKRCNQANLANIIVNHRAVDSKKTQQSKPSALGLEKVAHFFPSFSSFC